MIPPLAPAELGAVPWRRFDPDRPLPLVVAGSPAEWVGAARAEDADELAGSPAVTIAMVRGEAPPGARSLLDRFDLVAEGGGADDEMKAWVAAFERAPQAATVLGRLLRQGSSLLTESFAYSTLQAGREFRSWLASRPDSRPVAPGGRVRVQATPGGIEVVLARPDRHNAFDAQMREQLCDALDAAAEQPGTIRLRGDGPSFSSGGDLDEFGRLEDPAHAHLVRTSRSAAERLLRLSPRLVAGVHGHTIGAGIELSAFASRLLAAEETTFQLPEVAFGLLPGAGGTVSIPARIGPRRFLALAITGRTIDALTAKEWRLVDEVVPSGDLPRRLREVEL